MQNTINKSKRGGARPGAGLKALFGKTSVMRIPDLAKPAIISYLENYKLSLKTPASNFAKASPSPSLLLRPVYSFKIAAGATTGFASPAQDYEENEIDLNKHLITNPAATYFFPVGKDYDSMIDAGIQPGAMLVVDCSLKPKHTSIVVVAVDNEWIVKRLYKRGGVVKLLSENQAMDYPPILFGDGQELVIFGVVKNAINNIV